jgi:hypothetical protein
MDLVDLNLPLREGIEADWEYKFTAKSKLSVKLKPGNRQSFQYEVLNEKGQRRMPLNATSIQIRFILKNPDSTNINDSLIDFIKTRAKGSVILPEEWVAKVVQVSARYIGSGGLCSPFSKVVEAVVNP